MPFRRTSAFSAMPAESSIYVRRLNSPWKMFFCPPSRKISTATTIIAITATKPLRNCAQCTRFCDAISGHFLCRVLLRTLDELGYVLIGGCLQFRLPALKDQTALPEHHKHGLCPAVTRRIEPATVRIVPEIGHQIPVLIAVRNHQRRGIVHIPLFNDERHDGVCRDRIEPRRG